MSEELRKCLIDYLDSSKRKTVALGDRRFEDSYSGASIHYWHYSTAEFLADLAIKEKNPDDNGFPFHPYVSTALCAYVNALDTYFNHNIAFHLELYRDKDEIQDLINSGVSMIDGGLGAKLEGIYNFFGLKKEDFNQHEDMKILWNLRNEITHFFPYMIRNSECRNRVAGALNKADIEFDDRDHWSSYLSDVRLLVYMRKAFKEYIDQLCDAGFVRHLDSEKHRKKLNERK